MISSLGLIWVGVFLLLYVRREFLLLTVKTHIYGINCKKKIKRYQDSSDLWDYDLIRNFAKSTHEKLAAAVTEGHLDCLNTLLEEQLLQSINLKLNWSHPQGGASLYHNLVKKVHPVQLHKGEAGTPDYLWLVLKTNGSAPFILWKLTSCRNNWKLSTISPLESLPVGLCK